MMLFIDHLNHKAKLGVLTFEVTDERVDIMKDRLRARISEFEDLAEIENWFDIKNQKEITDRLQDAWDILYDRYYLKSFRCQPCEMESLCAIREIVGKPYVAQAMFELGNPEDIKKNIEDFFE